MSRAVLGITVSLAALTLYVVTSTAPVRAAPDLFDCADFPTQAAAQTYLRADLTDSSHLDDDHNGIACEGQAPCPCNTIAVVYNNGTPTPTPSPTPTRTPMPTVTPTAAVVPATPTPAQSLPLPTSTTLTAALVVPTTAAATTQSGTSGVTIRPPSTGDAGLR